MMRSGVDNGSSSSKCRSQEFFDSSLVREENRSRFSSSRTKKRSCHFLQRSSWLTMLEVSVFVFIYLARAGYGFIPLCQVQHTTRGQKRLNVIESEAAPRVEYQVSPDGFATSIISDVTCSAGAVNNGDEDDDDDDDDEEGVPAPEEDSSVERESSKSMDTQRGEITSELAASVRDRLVHAGRAVTLADRQRRNDMKSTLPRNKNTSIGPRRPGRETESRKGSRSTDRLLDAIRKASNASTVKKTDSDMGRKSIPREDCSVQHQRYQGSFFGSVSKASIHAAVAEMLDPSGALGLRRKVHADADIALDPAPGTVLVSPSSVENQQKTGRSALDQLTVRVATRYDDYEIANLRLSVFSDFSPTVRRTFCSKSCQLLASRRSRGATCVVATIPRAGTILSPRPEVIVGSAECSFHEFCGTTLGRSRLQESILYVTEVAVNPNTRRQGIGLKMMQAIEEIAATRAVETIYLHVDVANYKALSLYERAGYEKVNSARPMYYEFTKSLNLHDGATQGRNHFLLQKHLCEPTWLRTETREPVTNSGATLGFELLA